MHLSVFTRSSPAWSYTRGRSPSAWGQSGPGHPGCQTPRGRNDERRGGGQRDRRPGRRHCSCGVIRPWPEPRGRRGRGERRAGDTHSGQSRAWREQSVSYKYYKWTMGLLRHTGPTEIISVMMAAMTIRMKLRYRLIICSDAISKLIDQKKLLCSYHQYIVISAGHRIGQLILR